MPQAEIEIKVRVKNPQELEARMQNCGAVFLHSYDKKDSYYKFRVSSGKIQDVRLRSDGDKHYLTYKDKKLSDGVELSVEHESSFESPQVFSELFTRLGAELFIQKRKIGKAWDLDGITLELSEVLGLGFFLELEIVVACAEKGLSPEEEQRHKNRLFKTLERISLSQDDIETKTYTTMLLEAKNS